MHILIDIVLFSIFAVPAIRLIGRRRTITPKRVPEARPERRPGAPVSTSTRRVPLETERAEKAAAAPIQPATPIRQRKYLIGSPNAGRDTMATMLDMMSGPGICAPRDH